MGKGKMCEDCHEKHANFGLKGGLKQWCATCAKNQDAETVIGAKMCEDCKGKQANFGLKGGKKQWCGPCAERHG
eukprot:COSAG04_NODE_7340_length_1144_cov_1.370335_3_plen_73_part_01